MDLINWLSLFSLAIGTILTVISLKSEKYENTIKVVGAIFLILSALIATYNNTKSELSRDEQAKDIQNKVTKLNTDVSDIGANLETVSELSTDMDSVRINLEGSFEEYKNLNEKLKQQLEIEREKISNAKPNIIVTNPKSIIDSTNFGYQFIFHNDVGKRNADSLYYIAMMVFTDYDFENFEANLVKTNIFNYKPYTISGGYQQYINSNRISNHLLKIYKYGFLLIRYFYIDLASNELINEMDILKCTDLERSNIQYGANVSKAFESNIKDFLLEKHMLYYRIFYQANTKELFDIIMKYEIE